MDIRRDSNREDLVFGAVYGLGLSAAVWSLWLRPPGAEPALAVFLVLGLAAGLLRGRYFSASPLSPAYPVVLAALLAQGLGASVLVAMVSGWIAGAVGRNEGGIRPRKGGLGLASGALAASLSGTTFLLIGGSASAELGPALLLPVATHAVVFLATEVGLARLANGAARGRGNSSTGASVLQGLLCIVLVGAGPPLGWLAATTLVQRSALWIALVLLAFLMGWMRDGWVGSAGRFRPSSAIRRVLTSGLKRAIAPSAKGADQVSRVQALSLTIGRRMGLPLRELDALVSAAALYDAGKLALSADAVDVPPSDDVRAHPVVGAQILAAMSFPAAVQSIVRHQRERWDGRGFPDGLCAEDIPIGSRILAAAKLYVRLTGESLEGSDRSDADARTRLRGQACDALDPVVVDSLLDHLAHTKDWSHMAERLQRRAQQPAVQEQRPLVRARDSLLAIDDIARATRYPLSFEERLTLVARRLSAVAPFRSLVVYLLDETRGEMHAAFCTGDFVDRLERNTVRLGEGVSGRAALLRRSLIGRLHGDTHDSDSRCNATDWNHDPELDSLGHALTAPLVHDGRSVGALTLYDSGKPGYTDEQRRTLLHVAGYLAEAIGRAPRESGAAAPRLTDHVTGLPNGRYLRLELDLLQGPDHPTRAAGFGLLAFRVTQLTRTTEEQGVRAADKLLSEIARRLMSAAGDGETLTRTGPDLFVVLSPVARTDDLLPRWNAFVHAVEEQPFAPTAGVASRIRLQAAHAVSPEDGEDCDDLLQLLESRLTLAVDEGRSVVPFRPIRQAL